MIRSLRGPTGESPSSGDAAHPMLPFLSRGAAISIEDGYVLAEALAQSAATSRWR